MASVVASTKCGEVNVSTIEKGFAGRLDFAKNKLLCGVGQEMGGDDDDGSGKGDGIAFGITV